MGFNPFRFSHPKGKGHVFGTEMRKILSDAEKELVEVIRQNPGITARQILNLRGLKTLSNVHMKVSNINSKRPGLITVGWVYNTNRDKRGKHRIKTLTISENQND